MTALSFLDDPVLVLNRGYAATRVVPVRQAFVLLFRRVAEVISVIDGHWEQFDLTSWIEVAELQKRYEMGHHDWIRTGSAFDRIADVDTAMRDSEDPSLIKVGAVPNDHIVRGLRCTNIGYREIAAAIAQALLAVGYD